MLDLSASADALDGDVVRRIEKCHLGTLALHKLLERCGTARVVANELMLSELPKIAPPCDRLAGRNGAIDGVCRIRCGGFEVCKQHVDFGGLKARNRHIEIVGGEQLGQ